MESTASSTLAAAKVSIGGLSSKMVDEIHRMVGIQTSVVVTTVLLVARFLVDFLGPWYAAWSVMAFAVPVLEMLNYSMVNYTMGLMQLSAATVSDYFQVWAVLLVTLQYSVKVGRPYSRSKQIPLLDLMSSVWAANLLRAQTTYPLKIPLWVMWALNAARIISYFACTDKAVTINQKNLRLTADYMSYEHESGGSSDQGFTMDAYKYLVHGEDQVLKDLQEAKAPPAVAQEQEHTQRRRKKYGIRLDPVVHEKLITLDKIWGLDGGNSGLLGSTADQGNQLKDVCLSFALYKLLRRQFYDLPIHEARLRRQGEKIRRLVFKYILHDAERAFRIVATEISFLQDLFYSKHAATFANGFPVTNLMLSLSLIAATAYIAHPVRFVPERMDQVGHKRVTHGVLVTRLIVILIIGKELAEIYLYVMSQWTKVLMLCSYAKHQSLRRRPLFESAMRVLLSFMTRDRWDEKIHQYNILISTRAAKVPRSSVNKLWNKFPVSIRMEACTKEAIFQSIKRLEKNPESLGSYFSNAFGPPDQPLHKKLQWAYLELEAAADTHRILVWHIATALCEIDLLASDEAAALRPSEMSPKPFVRKPDHSEGWWEHYTTAASLSNYCSYLVMQALVPDNGLVTLHVMNEVFFEISQTITKHGSCLFQDRSMRLKDLFDRLTADNPDEDSLTCKGATLAKDLMDFYRGDQVGLWEKLAAFWTGFLLHLGASTRAYKHRTGLAGRRELATHVWALLSHAHAGYVRRAGDGQAAMDPQDRAAFDTASRL